MNIESYKGVSQKRYCFIRKLTEQLSTPIYVTTKIVTFIFQRTQSCSDFVMDIYFFWLAIMWFDFEQRISKSGSAIICITGVAARVS